MGILRTKIVLNFALSSILKEVKKCTIHLASEAPILVINDSLISEESKARNRM